MSAVPPEVFGEPPEPQQRPGPFSDWGVVQVLGVALASFFLTQISFAGFALMLGYDTASFGEGMPQDGRLLVSQFPGQLLAIVLCLLVPRSFDRERGLRRLGIGRRPIREFLRGLVWYLPVGATVWAGIFSYQSIHQYLFGESVGAQDVAQLATDPSLSILWLGLVALEIVVMAPLAEELFFRGLLHEYLRRHLPFGVAAVVIGALFGLAHGLSYAIPLGLFGVLLCWVRERIGLLAAVSCHALHNGIVFGLLRSGVL